MKHVRTDPACRYFIEPLTWLQSRRYQRRRGYRCGACMGDWDPGRPSCDPWADHHATGSQA